MKRFAALLTGLCLIAAAGAETRVELVDLRVKTAPVAAIEDGQVLLGPKNKSEKVPLADVSRIRLKDVKEPSGDRSAPYVVTTRDGSMLLASSASIAEDKLHLGTSLLGKLELPLSAASGVLFTGGKQTGQSMLDRLAELKLQPTTRDMLVFLSKNSSEWVGVECIVKGLSSKDVVFNYRDKDRTLERDRLVAILFAKLGADQGPPKGMLFGDEGGRIGLSEITMDAKSAHVVSPSLGKLEIARDRVGRIDIRSDRVASLTELKPVAVKQYGLFDTTFGWRSGKTAAGTALRLGGETYEDGLGLHSFCELTYELDGKYKILATTAGIDDSVRPAGRASLALLGDGKPLDEPFVLTGKDEPVGIRVPVKGVKKLTIRVEFGPDKLDVGDLVDLVEPRLIK